LLRVLIIKLSAFGDIIHSLPIIECFEEYFLKNNIRVELDWLIEKRWSPIIEDLPGVDNVIPINTKAWRRSLFSRSTWQEIGECWSTLRKKRYDLVLEINTLFKSAILARIARADMRVGFAKDSQVCREKHSIYLLDKTFSVPHGNVVDQTVRLVEKALYMDMARTVHPSLPPKETAVRMAEDALSRDRLLPGHFVLVTAGGGWQTKLLDEKLVADFCDCVSQHGLEPVLTWSGDTEKKRSEKIAALSKRNSVKQLGDLTLECFIEVLRMSCLVIGPDTGTVHAASAVETPTVSYYGPSSSEYSGPRRSTDRVVQLSPSCGPCFKRKCDKDLCNNLNIQRVLEEINNQLDGQNTG